VSARAPQPADRTPQPRPPAGAAARPQLVEPPRPAQPALVWLALGIVYVVWGSTYLGIRIAVETMPPLLMGAARFLVAGTVLYGVLRLRRGGAALRVSRRELISCCVIGCLLVTGGNGLVNLAEKHIASGLAALIVSSVPLWVVVMRRVTGERVPLVTLASVCVGFAGVALLLVPGSGHAGRAIGYVLVVCAAFSWALGSFASRSAPLPRDALLSTSLQMLAGGALSLVLGVATGEAGGLHPAHFSARSLVAFVYLIFIGSIVAYTAYVWLLQNAPISKAATYAYVNPVIAIFLGWAVLSESVTALTLAGAAIVVCSVAATVRRESR
jgi:drug/metabolite transporter (DMT)-like permease